MIKYLETIVESKLFDNIIKNDYIKALDQLSIRSKKYSQGSTIFCEGDILDTICIINQGSIKGEKTYADGEVHIVELYEEKQIIGLEAALSKMKTATMDYICNEDSRIVFISMRSIKKSEFYRQIMDALTQILADDNIKKMYKIEILARKGLRERIKIYLSILKKKSGADIVTVKMNREQLAQYLCVNRSALSNELSKMKREGIIDFEREIFKINK